jgi:replication factor A1
VGLLPPSGVVRRCPQCRRTLSVGKCREHGEVVGTPDLRTRLVVDDGTGTATVELGREATEEILGRSFSELTATSGTEHVRPVEDDLTDRTFGRHCVVTGRGISDEFGLTVFPESLQWRSPPLEPVLEAVRALLDRGAP